MIARLLRHLACLALVLTLAAPASAQRVLKINESLGPGSPEEFALLHFKKLVEEGTGDLRIQIHLLDALGKPDVALESLSTGSLELYSGALEYYATIVGAEINVISLPFFIGTHETLRAYLRSDAFKPAIDKLLAQGIRVLSTEWNADRGPYRVLMSSKPVRDVKDLDGLKVRMFPNEVYQRSWTQLGTVPIQLAWTETYLGIRQGTVNAVTSPLSLVRSMRFAEVAPYLIEIKEYPQTWPIMISERVWKTLNATQQALLVRAANEAGKVYAATTLERAQKDIDAMKVENKAEVIAIDRAAMRARLEPLYTKLVQEKVVPQALVDAVAKLPK
ncbi:MAG: TRAP transporter substrate-binding protein [Alphaproteobacteria bacterium]|nr:TRAP transporter substrate-binding protein [Alphaproteobacteria bacterium]